MPPCSTYVLRAAMSALETCRVTTTTSGGGLLVSKEESSFSNDCRSTCRSGSPLVASFR